MHTELQGHIRFEDTGVYAEDQERWVLRNINLDIPAGQTVGIVGPTGAGKSMLIGLLGRIHDPDEGSVLIDGYDLRSLKLAVLREHIVYVPQETLLFSMKLRDNIALGVPETPEPQINRAVERSRLVNDLPQLPGGIESLVGERGATLSGGQKQRTSIARALVREPTVLLLDDALASVDMTTSAEIIHELSQVGDQAHQHHREPTYGCRAERRPDCGTRSWADYWPGQPRRTDGTRWTLRRDVPPRSGTG